MTITANTKSVRNYVRNILATNLVRVADSWTDKSIPGHRNITFRVVYTDQSEMNEAYKYVSLGLAFEGIRVKYSQAGNRAAYLRLNRVPFDG